MISQNLIVVKPPVRKESCVYVLCDSRKPIYLERYLFCGIELTHEPIYVGKGFDNRPCCHLKRAMKKEDGSYVDTSFKANKIRSIVNSGHALIVVKTKSIYVDARVIAEEIKLIANYGRVDLGTGPLLNLTNGGDGTAGAILSKETIKKRTSSFKRFLDNMTPKELTNYFRSRTTKIQTTVNNKPLHVKQAQYKKHGEAEKQRWEELPEEAKKRHGCTIRDAHAARSEEEKLKTLVKTAATLKSRSEEEIQEDRNKKSAASKRMHAERDPEFKKDIYIRSGKTLKKFYSKLSPKQRREARKNAIVGKQKSIRTKKKKYVKALYKVLAAAKSPMFRDELQRLSNVPQWTMYEMLKKGVAKGTIESFGGGNRPFSYALIT